MLGVADLQDCNVAVVAFAAAAAVVSAAAVAAALTMVLLCGTVNLQSVVALVDKSTLTWTLLPSAPPTAMVRVLSAET